MTFFGKRVIIVEPHGKACWALKISQDKIQGRCTTCWKNPTLEYLCLRMNGDASDKLNQFLVWKCLNEDCNASIAIAIPVLEEILETHTKLAISDHRFNSRTTE